MNLLQVVQKLTKIDDLYPYISGCTWPFDPKHDKMLTTQ